MTANNEVVKRGVASILYTPSFRHTEFSEIQRHKKSRGNYAPVSNLTFTNYCRSFLPRNCLNLLTTPVARFRNNRSVVAVPLTFEGTVAASVSGGGRGLATVMIVRIGGLCPRERRRRSSHHHHGRHKGRHQQQTYALNHAVYPFLTTSPQRFSSQAVSGRM